MLGNNFYLLLYNIMAIIYHARSLPVKKFPYMSDCEVSVHTKCVINEGSNEKLMKDCNEADLLKCLRDHLTKDICLIHDPKTIPTIRSLIEQVIRRFKKNKKCANKKFLNSMQDHFLVQGEGIKYTDLKKYEYSGSGNIPDDTEGNDDDPEVLIESNVTHNKTKDNTIRYNVNYWKENAKKIMKGKKTVQLLVFFDDPQQYKKNKIKKQKTITKPVQSAWEKLKREYQRWWHSSRDQNKHSNIYVEESTESLMHFYCLFVDEETNTLHDC